MSARFTPAAAGVAGVAAVAAVVAAVAAGVVAPPAAAPPAGQHRARSAAKLVHAAHRIVISRVPLVGLGAVGAAVRLRVEAQLPILLAPLGKGAAWRWTAWRLAAPARGGAATTR